MAVMIKVNLPNRPEGDLVVVPGLGEFPNGEVSLVREDVLAAYAAANPNTQHDVVWPSGVDVLELTQDDLQDIFAELVRRINEAKEESAKKPAKPAAVASAAKSEEAK